MKNLKLLLPDFIVVVLFALISFAYFFPADFEGRILFRHDSSAGRGAGQEQTEYYQKTGERTRWTNSVFSGMPTYQLAPSYKSTTTLSKVEKAYHLWLPENVWYLFVYLLGFYILLRAFDFRQHLAALGSVVWAFSTYFLIIIAAGHIWKVYALAYLPPLIAGIVLAYRGKYLWGLVVTALFAALEVSANHVQMTYYYLFVIAALVIGWLVDAIRKKQLAHWLKATAVCLVGGLLGVLVNISNLYHTWQYSQETMRGKSELVKENSANQTSTGLDRDYITQWSYGIDETWTLLIPNAKGGSHNERLSDSKAAMEASDPQLRDFCGQWYQYWGEQPFTAGPVYVGAFVMMLFILGLFIVKGPVKWALLAATVLSILLSWGKNFMGLTDFFIDYVPMYAKFRTVSSILVIAEFTIPLLAMLALKKVIDEPEILTKKIKYVYASFGLTAGFCLLFALMPTVFFGDLVSNVDRMQLSQYVQDQQQLNWVTNNLSKMRTPIFTADCWRSFIIILVGALLLLFYKARKLKTQWLVGGIVLLCLVDLWPVNKRYLNDSMFVPRSEREMAQPMTKADQLILQDKTPDFRVLNVSNGLGQVFNENNTSYYHKSVGGYHAAKLRRYQELIDAYLGREVAIADNAIPKLGYSLDAYPTDSLFPVLNMLNTRYVIVRGQDQQPTPVLNPGAQGNAWFVSHVRYAQNANEELDALGKMSLRSEAVADEKFRSVLGESLPQDSLSTATLTSYEPNRLAYDVNSSKGGVLVFSEIYYPGWTVTVDGQPAELGRVNYVLRALQLKPGHHQVELSFFPQSVDTTETIATVSLFLLFLLFGGVLGWEIKKNWKV